MAGQDGVSLTKTGRPTIDPDRWQLGRLEAVRERPGRSIRLIRAAPPT
jgi:hypothetical protein